MATLIYSILLALGLITTPADFDNASVEEQQQMLIIVEDQTMM